MDILAFILLIYFIGLVTELFIDLSNVIFIIIRKVFKVAFDLCSIIVETSMELTEKIHRYLVSIQDFNRPSK